MVTSKHKPAITIYGYHSVVSALRNKQRTIYKIYALAKYKEELEALIKNNLFSGEIHIVDINFFKKNLEPNTVHQGISCTLAPITKYNINDFLASIKKKVSSCVLILDHATDSRNIGAMIRNSVAFNVDAIITTKNNAPQENALMYKASSGGIEKIKLIEVVNLQNTFNSLKKAGFWIVGLDPHTKQYINEIPHYEKIALVLGSEGEGLRTLTKKECDLLVKIPMSDNMESLNISNACAIALYEIYKKA